MVEMLTSSTPISNLEKLHIALVLLVNDIALLSLTLWTFLIKNMSCWQCGLKEKLRAPKCKNRPCQFCVEVAKVNEEINQAVAALRQLHAKRCDLLSEQNRAHDLMQRLPLELKSYIFELVLCTRNEWGQVKGPKGKMPPYLTSICRSWRDIAWSIPSLWSTIPIVLGTSSTSDSSWVNFVHNWILRSRTLPLTLLIKVPNRKSDDLEDELYDVLGVMSQYPHEWQTLFLDIPLSFLHIFDDRDSDLQSHLLTVKRLKIRCRDGCNRPVPPLIPWMNPGKIEILGLSFQSLQISWNHLTSAKVEEWDLEGIAQLFQHALQMTYCHISYPRCYALNFAMPPIIHQRLQSLRCDRDYAGKDVVHMLFGSLTLPCLRAIQTDLRTAANIPALVHRSSCPLSKIALHRGGRTETLTNLRPVPGVTDLVLDDMVYQKALLEKLLLEGYFPDLRQLTLGPQDFCSLFLPDVLNKLSLRKVFVPGADKSDPIWDWVFEELKVFQSSISWREDGFEMVLPEVVSSDEDTLPPVD